MLEKLAQQRHAHKNYRGAWPPLWFTEGLAEAMFKLLGDDAEHPVTVGIAFPTTRQSNDITKLVAFYGETFVQRPREITDRLKARP